MDGRSRTDGRAMGAVGRSAAASNPPPPLSHLHRQAPAAPGPGGAGSGLAGGGTKAPVVRARKEPKKDGEPKGARWKQVAALVGCPAPPPATTEEEDHPLGGAGGGWCGWAEGGADVLCEPSESVPQPAATLSSPKDGFRTALVPGPAHPLTPAPDPPTAAPHVWYPLPQPSPVPTKAVQALPCTPFAQLVVPGSASAPLNPMGALLAVAVGARSGATVGSGAV